MSKILFSGRIPGISAEEILRTQEFTMARRGHTKHCRFLLQLDAPIFNDSFSLPEMPDLNAFGDSYWGVAEFSPEDWHQVLQILDFLKKEMNRAETESNSICQLLSMQLSALFMRSRRQQEFSQRKQPTDSHQVHTGMHQKIHEIALYLQNHSTVTVPKGEHR